MLNTHGNDFKLFNILKINIFILTIKLFVGKYITFDKMKIYAIKIICYITETFFI